MRSCTPPRRAGAGRRAEQRPRICAPRDDHGRPIGQAKARPRGAGALNRAQRSVELTTTPVLRNARRRHPRVVTATLIDAASRASGQTHPRRRFAEKEAVVAIPETLLAAPRTRCDLTLWSEPNKKYAANCARLPRGGSRDPNLSGKVFAARCRRERFARMTGR